MQVPQKTPRDYWIAPSILSADFARLGEEVDAVLSAGADMIHFDVMDNHFVPNLTVGPLVCKALRRYGVTAPIDVHLMVEPVDSVIEQFLEAGASCISFHPQATRHIDRSLELVKSAGAMAGLVLNPATPLSLISPVLHKLDILLLMSVNPGFGGQKFIPYVLEKVKEARREIDRLNLNTRLEVDGGVNESNLAELAEAGADTFVMGSAIFGAGDYHATLARLRKILSNEV